jgi:hypothetical protein
VSKVTHDSATATQYEQGCRVCKVIMHDRVACSGIAPEALESKAAFKNVTNRQALARARLDVELI